MKKLWFCKFLIVLLVLVLLVSFVSFVNFYIRPVKATDPSLHVVGTHLEDGDGNNVTLRSINVDWNERRKLEGKGWTAPSPGDSWFLESDVLALKSYNSNCIEIFGIPFRYIMLTKNVVNTEYFEDWCDYWVNWCSSNGVYVILTILGFEYGRAWCIPNWIWSEAGYSQPETKAEWDTVIRAFFDTDVPAMDSNRQAFVNAWKGIANRYKTNDYVLFNIMNEPLCTVDKVNEATSNHLAETYSEFMEDVVDGIHSTNAENIIIIDQPFTWYMTSYPVNRNGIIWEAHMYISYSYDYEDWKDYVDTYISKFVGTYGKPLYFGEFGFSPQDYGTTQYPSTWLNLLTDQMDYLNNKTLVGTGWWQYGYLEGEHYDYVYNIYTESESEDILNVIFDFMSGEEEGEGGEPPDEAPDIVLVSLSLKYPIEGIYVTSTIPVEIFAQGGTIDKIWYNVKNGSNWVYGSNLTYTVVTTMTDFVDGTYTFYAWANNTEGESAQETGEFSVSLSFFSTDSLYNYNVELQMMATPIYLTQLGP